MCGYRFIDIHNLEMRILKHSHVYSLHFVCRVQFVRFDIGTNCVDNGSSREGLKTFLEKSLPDEYENVSHYEFMAG